MYPILTSIVLFTIEIAKGVYTYTVYDDDVL